MEAEYGNLQQGGGLQSLRRVGGRWRRMVIGVRVQLKRRDNVGCSVAQ